MTWMTWRSLATLIARLASTTRWTSSSPISWSGWATATTPVEFWLQVWVPPSETTTDSMRWPAMRSAATVAARMEAMVLSRLTTTPLRRPSEGLSPTPRMLTGAPGSSDSAMTTATRLVPRSRPTVFFRRDKTCAGTPPGTTRSTGGVVGIISAPGRLRGHILWVGPLRVLGLVSPLLGNRLRAGLLCSGDAVHVRLHVLGDLGAFHHPLAVQVDVVAVDKTADRLGNAMLHALRVVLELLDLAGDARWDMPLVEDVLGGEHRLVCRDEGVLAAWRHARHGAAAPDLLQRADGSCQRRRQVDIDEPVSLLVVGDERRRCGGRHLRAACLKVGELAANIDGCDRDNNQQQCAREVDPLPRTAGRRRVPGGCGHRFRDDGG